MTVSPFERATFGNKANSHQLLHTTLTEGSSALDQLRFLVDRPAGHVESSVVWSPYWGCQPVDSWWVLWRGEEDIYAPRRNMVKVEVVLLPISLCAEIHDLDEVLAAIGYTEDESDSNEFLQLAGTVIQHLSTKGNPVAIPGISLAPGLLRALWPQLWPSMKASFSLRTVFAAEYLTGASPPNIAVFPAELTPRWHSYPILKGHKSPTESISRWFSGEPSALFKNLLETNFNRLPGDFSVLSRVERIVERLERLHSGKGTISDALVVARTQESFSAGFNLPGEDLEALTNSLADLSQASAGDIRAASLTQLPQITDVLKMESALVTWIQTRLTESSDQDAIWILEHHHIPNHAQWWRSGVSRGLVAAFKQRHTEWARALWRWWTLQPSSVNSVAMYLEGSSAVESWLANETPKAVKDDLFDTLLDLCKEHDWATLLARLLGSERQLFDCISTLREVVQSPEAGMTVLLTDRSEVEIVTAAAATNWSPLIVHAARITQKQTRLFKSARDLPGLIPLLLEHLRAGGDFPSDLKKPDFIATVFEGVLQHEQQIVDVAGFLGAFAGASALDHPAAEQLLGLLNADVISGASAEWWERFATDDNVGAPPRVIRLAIIHSVPVRCAGASVVVIIRFLHLFPEVSEETFVKWMMHTGFFWGKGDHERMATLLLKRSWRTAAKTFRYSWKQELKVVAWYARDLLSKFDTLLWGAPSEADATAVPAPIAIVNPTRGKMKITFLASNPATSDRLALDEEARQIEEKIRASKHRDLVTFRTHWAVRPEDLQQTLLEDEPVIVHFSGHGGGTVGIVLHSQDQDNERFVAEKALTDLFRIFKGDIRVVVLNACYSEVQAAAIVKEIDFVIGMSDSVGDEAARVFAAAFYRGLSFGKSVQRAFDLGISELGLVGLEHEERIPKLLVRSGVDASTTVLVGGA